MEENKKDTPAKTEKKGAYERVIGTLTAATKAMEDFAKERTSKGMSVTRVKNAARAINDVKKVMAQYGSN